METNKLESNYNNLITIILKGSLEILEKKRHILLYIYFLLHIILRTDFSQNRKNLIIIIYGMETLDEIERKEKKRKRHIILQTDFSQNREKESYNNYLEWK